MVKIIDNATFNRTSLLGELADDAYALNKPGDDYVKATRLVWLAMKNQALSQDGTRMTGDNGRDGIIVTGMGPIQALNLIWPGMDKAEMMRSRTAVVSHLKRGDNAVCIRQGKSHTLAEWWIAIEWQEPQISGRAAALSKARPKRRVKRPTPKVTQRAEVVADHLEVEATTTTAWPEAAVTVDDLENAFATIRKAFASLATLQDENKQLSDRLARINDVIKGE